MLELIGLVISTAGIASFARGRGASPYFFGSLTVGGYILIRALGLASAPSGSMALVFIAAAWCWVGSVAFFARFIVGANRPQPAGLWVCPGCHTTNGEHAVICEACRQPWQE